MEKKPQATEFQKGTAISYALSQGGGFMLIQATVATFFSIFMTDTVLIPAASASVIMLIVCLIFNPIELHRQEINEMKEKMHAIE